MGSKDKLVHALDPKTGECDGHSHRRGRVDGSPVIVGDRVFVGSGDGRLYAIQLKTGKELWRIRGRRRGRRFSRRRRWPPGHRNRWRRPVLPGGEIARIL